MAPGTRARGRTDRGVYLETARPAHPAAIGAGPAVMNGPAFAVTERRPAEGAAVPLGDRSAAWR
jgi:hypothetical protein